MFPRQIGSYSSPYSSTFKCIFPSSRSQLKCHLGTITHLLHIHSGKPINKTLRLLHFPPNKPPSSGCSATMFSTEQRAGRTNFQYSSTCPDILSETSETHKQLLACSTGLSSSVGFVAEQQQTRWCMCV